jgi:tetratricopeptide (TPR) repeat protein
MRLPASRRRSPPAATLLVVAMSALMATTSAGCRAVRGRKMIQDANELYRRGRYQEAVALFDQAEKLVPDLPVLWLNKGYTCRQLVIPGAARAENRQAAACALDAFAKLKELRPGDPRGEQLFVQTLFDTDDLPALERLFYSRAQQHPDDLDAVRGLQQVYYKSGRWPAALEWSRKAAALRPRDAEAQYAVGTLIWQVLSSHGGGAEMVSFDPRPKVVEEDDEEEAPAPVTATRRGGRKDKGKDKDKDKDKGQHQPAAPRLPAPPPAAAGDITGSARAELADEGISYLEKAVALRPRFGEAMTYLGLLERQRSFAYFAEPEKWQSAVDQSRKWQEKAAASRSGGKP